MKNCFDRFPSVLREALESERTKFPKDIQWEYEDMEAYRAIDINENKRDIAQSDFDSQVEKGKKVGKFKNLPKDIEYYSCSCFFTDKKLLKQLVSLKDRIINGKSKIAKGVLRFKNGPILVNKNTEHIHWFLFKNVDVVRDFKFIKTNLE